MPSFGNRSSSGTYIDDLGYYWAPNDYMDVKTMIDFEDRRGLYIQTNLRYNKNSGEKWYNYKMNGSIFYESKTYLLEGVRDFKYMFDNDSTREITNIQFKHSQIFDPTQNLSINYNFKSARDTNEVDLNKRLDQTLSSNFYYMKRWEKSSMSINYYQFEDLYIAPPDSINQEKFVKYDNGPTINYSLNSRKIFGNGDKWFNKIYMNYNLIYNHGRENFYKNAYQENDSTISWGNNYNTEDLLGGLANKIKFSMSNQFGWLTLIPSLSINEDWLLESDASNNSMVPKFSERRLMWNISLNANTKIYGIIPLKLGKIEAIRHKIMPEVSFTYQPNFIETEINDIDPFMNSFHQPTSGGYSRATFRLNNLFQAKIKTKDNIYEKRDILTWDMIVSYNPNNQDSGENNLSNLNSYLSFKKPNGGEYLSVSNAA